jgi:3'-phosphoadenosine 5'-phosphosulfate sulfotransferase (PAPS reductase)/FAD synthetase
MTGLLQEALRRVESLSSEEQDAIASQIIETLDDEAAWARSFSKDQAAIRSLAREALDEHRRGETRPLDELLG